MPHRKNSGTAGGESQHPSGIADSYQIQLIQSPSCGEKEVDLLLEWLKEKNLLKNEVTYEGIILHRDKASD